MKLEEAIVIVEKLLKDNPELFRDYETAAISELISAAKEILRDMRGKL